MRNVKEGIKEVEAMSQAIDVIHQQIIIKVLYMDKFLEKRTGDQIKTRGGRK